MDAVSQRSQPTFTGRMYARVEDRDRIARFLVEAVAAGGVGYWHPGDLTWGMYQNTVFNPKTSLRLWEGATAGALLGVTWLESYGDSGEVETQLAPDIRQTETGAAILTEALDWARRVAQRRHLVKLWARARDSDAWQVALLQTNGFTRDDRHAHYVHFGRPFDAAPLPDAPLPDGFRVRAVGGPEEWQRRVDLHRVVYHPSRVTLKAYRRLRAASNFRPELDLVAVTPDGEFVSYSLLWLDDRNWIGEYEPVGAHPAWRRQGITRAVLVEGLRRLRALGAERAIVLTSSANTPAIRLYESVGFTPHDNERYYRAR